MVRHINDFYFSTNQSQCGHPLQTPVVAVFIYHLILPSLPSCIELVHQLAAENCEQYDIFQVIKSNFPETPLYAPARFAGCGVYQFISALLIGLDVELTSFEIRFPCRKCGE